MGQTGSCRSCSSCKSSQVLLAATRLDLELLVQSRPAAATDHCEKERRGNGRRGTRPETVPDRRQLTPKGVVGLVVIVQVCETQIQTAAGRHLQLCTNRPPSRLWVLHPSHGGWDAMQDVSTSELHREIDAWPAAAGPVASDWLPEARAGPAGRSNRQHTQEGHLRGARRNPPHLSRRTQDRRSREFEPLASCHCVRRPTAPAR